MIRYGTIGTGWIVDSFIRGTLLRDELKLTAVHSRDRERGETFAANYGVTTVFTDLEEMAKSDLIDAVYIGSPNFLHPVQAKLFIENGKHVIAEKPITVTPAELEGLQKLAKEKGVIYMEAIMMMHLPARKALKEAVSKIGNIFTASFDFSQLSSKYKSYAEGGTPNIFNPACCTGAMMDLGIYCIYPALDLFGEPESIEAFSGFLRTGADGWGTTVFRYPDKMVTLTWAKAGQSRLGSQIFGDQGTVTIPSISCMTDIKLWNNDGEATDVWGSEDKFTLMGWEAHDFYRYITDPEGTAGEYAEASEMALRVSRVMETIREKAGIKFPYEEVVL